MTRIKVLFKLKFNFIGFWKEVLKFKFKTWGRVYKVGAV
jgi:hypothetical protein